MQKHGQEKRSLMLDPLGTSIQQKDEVTLLNIVLPSYMGLGLEVRDLPTCPKLQQLSRSQRKPQLIFMRDSGGLPNIHSLRPKSSRKPTNGQYGICDSIIC
jgi:hypothetical protein